MIKPSLPGRILNNHTKSANWPRQKTPLCKCRSTKPPTTFLIHPKKSRRATRRFQNDHDDRQYQHACDCDCNADGKLLRFVPFTTKPSPQPKRCSSREKTSTL